MTDTDLLPDEIWIEGIHDAPTNVIYTEEPEWGAARYVRTPSSTRANERGDEVHPCACKFRDDDCIDPCAYHVDLEDGYKRLEKINDELGAKLAKWHNEKIGFTKAAPPQPSPQSDTVAVPREVMEQLWTKAQEIGYHAEMDVLKGKRRGHWIKPVAYEVIALLQPYTKGD